ncbi:hypothetical protein FQR65_LT11193 [Abscondita terminalis]|nr:hypothetical protein FQR65_LT11193 [Abscondita terminalis]
MGRARATSTKNTTNSNLLTRRRNRRADILRVSWSTIGGDERMEGMSLVLNQENTEPDTTTTSTPKYRYSREELLDLQQHPLSQKRPEHLSVAFTNSNGVWDPELWHRSRSETPNENGVRAEEVHKRRPGDPRERIRKEQDGIVLSPQRRSFNSGCFVPLKENQRSNRQHSPIGKTEPHIVHREISQSTRRIGSGRILSRDVPWDYQDKQETDNDFGYRRDDRFERRFGRDFDKEKEKRGGRFGDGRRRVPSDNRDEEPEWFSGGPVSQAETIELRGFDENDCEKMGKKKISKKRLKERNIKPVEESKEKEGAKSNTPEKLQSPIAKKDEESKSKNDLAESDNSFSFDDILKCDTIASLLPNGVVGDEGDTSGSRFSRWFKRESPVKQTHGDSSRRSSLQDEHLIRNLLNDIAEPNVSIPGDSDLYFAPISPAASTGSGGQKPLNLMEMLQKGKNDNHMGAGGKFLSLAELEARMMHQGAGDSNTGRSQTKHAPKSHEDMMAFKQLLAQVSGGQAVAATNGSAPMKSQSMSILEMLSHSQQQDEAARLTQMMGPTSPNPINNDLAFKLQQVQNHVQAQQRQQAQLDMLNKLINAGMHRQQLGSPLHEVNLNQSRELLNRPEAQAILQGLKRGDITSQHLYQQLAANPAMQPRHRELLLTILKLHGGGGGTGVGPSPRVLSPVLPHSIFQPQQQQQQQQLRVSPLPTAYCVSPILATSPNTLTVPARHPNIALKIDSILTMHSDPFCRIILCNKLHTHTQIFVICLNATTHVKGYAILWEKNHFKIVFYASNHIQKNWKKRWRLRLYKFIVNNSLILIFFFNLVGRPIVKANANLQTPQDQFYHHQQQQQQQRMYNQQRKLGPQFPSMNHSQTGASSHQQPIHFPSYSTNPQQFQQQLTQHQLRAQHQQHQPPQQQNQYGSRTNSSQLWSQQHTLLGGSNYDGRLSHIGGDRGANGGDLSPTSNQLARWFSPELLERARAGKVPNLPSTATAQHAISLEELERQTAPPVHN